MTTPRTATLRVAHKPMLAPQGLDASKASRGEGFMLYWIDQAKNHSKFYEGLMLPNDDGTFRVMLRWGALTDSGFTGRIDGANFDSKLGHLSAMEAKSVLAKKYRDKTGKGYIDAWGSGHKTPDGKALPKGQYPVGLKRDVGFGWGVQEAAFCIPALRQIQTLLAKVQDQLRGTSNPSAASSLMESATGLAKGALWAADSTMARKVLVNLAHMQGRADFIMAGDYSRIPYDKAIKDWTVALSRLMSYIDKQLSVCHGKVAEAKVAEAKVAMNFVEVINRAADKFVGEVAAVVAAQLGWGVKQGSGSGAWVVTGAGQYISLEMDLHNTPFMIEVRGSVQPFKAAVFTASMTAGKIVAYVKKGLRLAGFDPENIGAIKKPSGDPDEKRIVEDTDQRWFSEVTNLYPSTQPVWDGSGEPPESYKRTLRLASRYLIAQQDPTRVARVVARWMASQGN